MNSDEMNFCGVNELDSHHKIFIVKRRTITKISNTKPLLNIYALTLACELRSASVITATKSSVFCSD